MICLVTTQTNIKTQTAANLRLDGRGAVGLLYQQQSGLLVHILILIERKLHTPWGEQKKYTYKKSQTLYPPSPLKKHTKTAHTITN